MNVLADAIPTMRSISPFRYPGGKAFLYKHLAERISMLPSGERYYAEPFCGGAGSAVILLKLNLVDRILLNDADIKVYSAWKSILDDTELFVERIQRTPLNIDSWHGARATVENSSSSSFELGFATFFLNRTSRSGIVAGAGPIGGYDQAGRWKMDARFNRDALIERVRWLASVKDKIALTKQDGLAFLAQGSKRDDKYRTLFFVDPPYVTAGGRLYLNAMNEAKHIALSDILQDGSIPHWLLTYDDHPLIRDLYKQTSIKDLAVTYSLQKKRKEQEILIND